MADQVLLRGTTWDHPRAWAPLVVLAEKFTDTPVRWDVRSLQAFADQPLQELIAGYDLLVVDHPFVGEAAERNLLLPLDGVLDATELDRIRTASVGPSWDSYTFGGRAFALPIDAAGHVSAWRPDLLGGDVPATWNQVLDLARARHRSHRGRVGVAMMPTDLWCLFLTVIASSGAQTFRPDGVVVDRQVGLAAVGLLRDLAACVHEASRTWNPIHLFDAMSTTDEVAYCPAAFGYTTYAITGFRPRLLSFGAVPRLGAAPARPLMGGAGIAVSARSRHARAAAGYALRLCRAEVQAGEYAAAGGQPAHRAAWLEPACDARVHGSFSRTLPHLDMGFLRPRIPGFVELQSRLFGPLAAAVWDGADPDQMLEVLDREWRRLVRQRDAEREEPHAQV